MTTASVRPGDRRAHCIHVRPAWCGPGQAPPRALRAVVALREPATFATLERSAPTRRSTDCAAVTALTSAGDDVSSDASNGSAANLMPSPVFEMSEPANSARNPDPNLRPEALTARTYPSTSGALHRSPLRSAPTIDRVITEQFDLDTGDGLMPTWLYRPGLDGPRPLVMYLMDAPSIRPALHDMASRLATAGYYVMMPYLFYRGGPYREFGSSDEDMHARRDLMGTVTPTGILADAAAMLAHADADPAADTTRFGAVGFCMSGGLTLAIAKAHPGRMKAAASIHGAWLVRDSDDSPHLGLDRATAELYFGWADNDPTAPLADRKAIEATLEAADLPYTIDVYADAVHGYAPAGERYHRFASEQHWERVHDMFLRRLLRPS